MGGAGEFGALGLLTVLCINAGIITEPSPLLRSLSWVVLGGIVFHVAYVALFRMRGRPFALLELATPFLEATVLGTLWIAVERRDSFLWVFFLYGLVAHSRRLGDRHFFAFALMCVAIVISGQTHLDLRAGEGWFSSNVIAAGAATAAMAGLAYSTARQWRSREREARALAETDPLTGIPNRRSFLAGIEDQSNTEPFAVLMLDLDNFKRLNDRYGHLAGDDVLVRVARVLQEHARPGDRIARYGGEEFAMLLPNTTGDDALMLGERIRRSIRERTPATVSIGCAVQREDEQGLAVLGRADDLLLAAKRGGKDKTLTDSDAGQPRLRAVA